MTRRVRSVRRGPARAWILSLVLGLAAATLSWSSPAGADAFRRTGDDLEKAIDAVLADPRLAGGAASVVVADAATGDTLYEHRPADRLMPASNTKLPTSAAAMELLGPGYRFTTDVLTDGRRSGSVLTGDLYLRGTGDPTMLAKDYDRLAADLARSGVKRITGRLIADDTRFDNQRLGRSWAADDESSYYSAQISPLTVAPDTDYDAGTVIVEAAPGARAGAKPRVKVTPANGYVRIDNRATTLAEGGRRTLTVEREHGRNTITVTGGIPVGGATAKEWVSVWEPTGYAAAVFADALADHGVRIEGPTRLGLPTPADAERLAAHRSMPLKKLLVPFMKLSNNNHAEVLTKTIGYKTTGKGTWSAGLTAIGGYLKRLGVDPGTLRQVDGSGLSRMNTVPARAFAELLLSVRDEPWYADWYAALPVACDPDRLTGGTLRGRMCGTAAERNARAKTGSLTGASALSGYVTDADGRELVYAIVLNNHLAASVKSVEDAIVVTLASWGEDGGADGRSGGTAPARPRGERGADRAGAPGTEPGAESGAESGAEELECAWRKPVLC
ncbi:D-alanyl-D-alanine carboxypeptidase/D-alanyl-D-alanine-endopeptidase [Streptomyces sp. XD-27]|uniref:D-alanyl-D-alanine carboxypeptidase/D-alanyl-D-alanine endopeptidase n=1 Tax=Streptomyces sp. XD-27 TaxID=3062779 RepID=UPI0026F4719F|nr:D-alanyl-D-alanine carboxypeptidase/D-alanyl-D-alanine-endopeptidase [Streptomyces sp. XD-27]WKX70650.1 D-alanyl-D-alanine carboxypeptidase/D-alanyl-D-alanine-endopeptidase [Streptomyces sp. XD-27]